MVLRIILLFSLLRIAAVGQDLSFDPNHPDASGYQVIFNGTFPDLSSIATNQNKDPQQPGFNWYTRLFPVWGGYWSKPQLSVQDGVVTIVGGQIGTAAPTPDGSNYVGTVFTGGAYFEASFSFDPTTVSYSNSLPISNDNWWPSFYSVPTEYLTGNDQWPGQPDNFVHFAEDDFFESWQDKTKLANRYGATIHDWWGPRGCNGKSGAAFGCDIANDGKTAGVPRTLEIDLPSDNDWNRFHTVGNLWVAATPTSAGYIQSYFDGKLLDNGRVTWQYSDVTDVPPSGNSVFSIIDKNHMVVYIGSPANTALHVQYVRVWQIPTAAQP